MLFLSNYKIHDVVETVFTIFFPFFSLNPEIITMAALSVLSRAMGLVRAGIRAPVVGRAMSSNVGLDKSGRPLELDYRYGTDSSPPSLFTDP